MVGTVAGVSMFLALLTVAVQVLVDLHQTSVVTAAGYDAARLVASEGGEASAGSMAAAEVHARSLLGAVGDEAAFTWDVGDDVVRLRVVVPTRRFLLPVVAGVLGIDEVDRTVAVRVEELQG